MRNCMRRSGLELDIVPFDRFLDLDRGLNRLDRTREHRRAEAGRASCPRARNMTSSLARDRATRHGSSRDQDQNGRRARRQSSAIRPAGLPGQPSHLEEARTTDMPAPVVQTLAGDLFDPCQLAACPNEYYCPFTRPSPQTRS